MRSREPAGFVLRYTCNFGPDLYGHRPTSHLMDCKPLVVEADLTPETLGARLLNARAGGLLRGFVVVRAGVYVGQAWH